MRLGSRMTAAATTGPASGPRPASSQPATGQTPRLIAARAPEGRADDLFVERQPRARIPRFMVAILRGRGSRWQSFNPQLRSAAG